MAVRDAVQQSVPVEHVSRNLLAAVIALFVTDAMYGWFGLHGGYDNEVQFTKVAISKLNASSFICWYNPTFPTLLPFLLYLFHHSGCTWTNGLQDQPQKTITAIQCVTINHLLRNTSN